MPHYPLCNHTHSTLTRIRIERISVRMTTPAQKIIDAFGGVHAAARALKIAPTTVQGWKERGFIPSPRQSEVLTVARDAGLSITETDFFGPAPDKGAVDAA